MRRLSIVFLVTLAIYAPAWGIAGKVVDNNGRPIAGARVTASFSGLRDELFHADENGEFAYGNKGKPDGTVTPQSFRVIDRDGKPAPKATVLMPVFGHDPTVLTTDAAGQFTYEFPEPSKAVLRILDSAGAPLVQAKLISASGQTLMNDMITDEKGEYVYPKQLIEDRSSVSLTVTADGYTYESADAESTRLDPLTVTLWPAEPLKATVVGEDQSPVQGASVSFSSVAFSTKDNVQHGFQSGPYHPGIKLTKGADGSFTLLHIPRSDIATSGNIRLVVDAPGRARIERSYDIAVLRKNGNILLPRECIVQGTLYPPGKTGIIPDRLALDLQLLEDDGPQSPTGHIVQIGKDGKFRFDKLAPGKATISLSTERIFSSAPLPWTMPEVKDIRILPGEVKTLKLVGTPGALVSGVIKDGNGNPVEVPLTVEDAASPQGGSYSTDKNGEFKIRVAAGKVTVYVASFTVDGKQVDYEQNDRPSVTVIVADGEEKSGLDFSISPPVKRKEDVD